MQYNRFKRYVVMKKNFLAHKRNVKGHSRCISDIIIDLGFRSSIKCFNHMLSKVHRNRQNLIRYNRTDTGSLSFAKHWTRIYVEKQVRLMEFAIASEHK